MTGDDDGAGMSCEIFQRGFERIRYEALPFPRMLSVRSLRRPVTAVRFRSLSESYSSIARNDNPVPASAVSMNAPDTALATTLNALDVA